ncbi:MAG: methionine biosynthesis protein MetW [Anaerolineae bacterium]|nr:methionine biosynthesis protein MetW [Anaerolineae bacterium]
MSVAESTGQVGVRRLDYDVIVGLVEPGSRVLDLGCGDGLLLSRLIAEKGARGAGVEISQAGVQAAIARGLSVVQGDLDQGLADYQDKSFDWVILNQTLQSLLKPVLVLDEMLRVGRRAIVGFPNCGYWQARLQLLLTGRMPSDRNLSYRWYDTPATRLLTIKDFRAFCAEHGIAILREVYLGGQMGERRHLLPNLRAETGIFVLAGDGRPSGRRLE